LAGDLWEPLRHGLTALIAIPLGVSAAILSRRIHTPPRTGFTNFIQVNIANLARRSFPSFTDLLGLALFNRWMHRWGERLDGRLDDGDS